MPNLNFGGIGGITTLSRAIKHCKKSTNIAILILCIAVIVATYYNGLYGLGWTLFVATVSFVAGAGSLFLLIFDKDSSK